MAGSPPSYHYSVVRDVGGPRYADVALIRWKAPHGVLEHLRGHDRRDAVVLHHRSFKPMLELSQMEDYAAQLEQAARHGNNGTLGCFVEINRRDDGVVRVILYDRWFDGHRLRCEELAHRDFDASRDDAVVASSEFLVELQAWAAEQNERRETSYLDAAEDERAVTERAVDRQAAATGLANILASHNEQT